METKTNVINNKDSGVMQLTDKKFITEGLAINEFQATMLSTAHKYPILHSLDNNSNI